MPETLWAPWRMAYIERPETGTGEGADIFVDLPAEDDDRKNLILHRGRTAFLMMNAYPYTNGHLLVAPFRKVADVTELTDEETLEIGQLVAKGVAWVRKAYRPDGFNLGVNMGRAAGAGIPQHLHWHVVPRWNGDTNFMTSVGDVRVMPQDLYESYDRLRAANDEP
jgi:ATP adenylyltransferase